MGITHASGRTAVVIPVYGARFLAQALESVFFQSHPPDDVVVVDDGSPDPEAVQRAVAPYADCIVVLRQDNRGAGAARNAGIAATTAEFIAFLDADDRWLPHFLETQLTRMRAEPALDAVYTDGLLVGHTPLAGNRFMALCPSEGDVTLESLLLQQCTVLLSSSMVRREALLAIGGFDAALRRGQDFDLWLRLARRGGRIGYQREVLVLHRLHDQNLSGTMIDQLQRPLRVLRKTIETMPLTAGERQLVERRIKVLESNLARERGKELLLRGEYDAARRAFADACGEPAGWKTQAARLALYVAPQLLRRVYQTRLATASS